MCPGDFNDLLRLSNQPCLTLPWAPFESDAMRAGHRGESSAGGNDLNPSKGRRRDGRRGDGGLHPLLFRHGVLCFVSEIAASRAVVTGNAPRCSTGRCVNCACLGLVAVFLYQVRSFRQGCTVDVRAFFYFLSSCDLLRAARRVSVIGNCFDRIVCLCKSW